jgi:hypothetical protein
MPNPIDRCGACQQPLYVEDNIPGGCGCPDRDFRVLLAQQRHRNNTGNEDFASTFVAASAPPPNLSEVDPGLLMSAAGRSEFEAAQQLAGPSFRAAIAQGLRGRTEHVAFLDDQTFFGHEARTMTDTANPNVSSPRQAQPVAPVDDEIDLDAGDEWTGNWDGPSRHQARVASTAAQMADVDLAAMWMQGTGIPFDRSQLVAPGGDGFEFDTGELAVDTSAYPRGGGVGGGRFRVDAAPPPRPAFNRGLVNNQGPMTEATRVRGGRFAVLREQAPAPAPNIFDQVRADFAAPPPPPPRPEPRTAPVSAVQQARAVQAKPRGPSVYDLIRSNPLRSK